MPYAIAAIALVLSGIMGKLWWDEKHAERPILPPSFVEQRIKQAALVPVTEHISKIYAICPEDNGLWGIGGVAQYLMSWTAKVNYSIDLSAVTITKQTSPQGNTWIINAPQIALLNNGDNLISDKDHYKFHNKALVAKSAAAMNEHYTIEKKRAEKIAHYIATWRIEYDRSLTLDIENQLKLIFYAQIAQIADKQPDFKDLKVMIAQADNFYERPKRPELCTDQPFESHLALNELND